MNVYCLYFPDGKRYVGVESHSGRRIRSHLRAPSPSRRQLVSKAIAACGHQNVQWRYLASNCSKTDGLALERFFIRSMRLTDPQLGHNVSPGISNVRESEPKAGVTEVRVLVDAEIVQQLRDLVGSDMTTSELVKDALNMLVFGAEEVAKGRRMGSFEMTGKAPCTWGCYSLTRAEHNKN